MVSECARSEKLEEVPSLPPLLHTHSTGSMPLDCPHNTVARPYHSLPNTLPSPLLYPPIPDSPASRLLFTSHCADWDQQRADYIRKHPGCNATSNAMPKVMLVTGSQPGTCGNDVGDFLLLRSIKNKMDYVDRRPNMQVQSMLA